MAMNKKNNNEIVADINMTPLIDVMLVLLIIFMLGSSAALESGLDVDLPQTGNVQEKSNTVVVVSLAKSGELAVQGTKADMGSLVALIKDQLAALKTQTVVLEGDAQSSLETVVQIADAAKQAGAKDFSIAAKMKSN